MKAVKQLYRRWFYMRSFPRKRLLANSSLSFVICSVGSRDQFIDTHLIPAIMRQDIGNFEIVIVGKYHGTYRGAPRVKYIEVSKWPIYFYKPFQRGVETSKAEWIVDLDDDMVLSDDWYSNLLAGTKEVNADVYGFKLINPNGSIYGDVFDVFGTHDSKGGKNLLRSYFGSYVARRWIFDVIPYPTYMSGDRCHGLLVRELGLKKKLLPNATVIHYGTLGADSSIPRADGSRYHRTLDLRKRLSLISPTTAKDYQAKTRRWWSYSQKIEKLKKHIGILGWYGHGNIGDELILRTMLRLFAQHKISVYSDKPQEIRECHRISEAFALDRLRHDLEKLDLLLIGGGGVLHDRYIRQVLPENLIINSQTPLIVYAAGIPFLEWLTHQIDYFVNRCYLVTLRDKTCLNYFQQQFPNIPSQFLPDPVFSMSQIGMPRISGKVVLNIRMVPEGWKQGLPSNANEILLGELAKIYDYLVLTGYSPMVLGFEPRDELFLKSSGWNYKMVDLNQAIEEIGTAELLIGTRYHSGIIAITQRTPAILINYQGKIEGLKSLVSEGIRVVNIEDMDAVEEFKRFSQPQAQYRDDEIQALRNGIDQFNNIYINGG